jgi:hypothetical protein
MIAAEMAAKIKAAKIKANAGGSAEKRTFIHYRKSGALFKPLHIGSGRGSRKISSGTLCAQADAAAQKELMQGELLSSWSQSRAIRTFGLSQAIFEAS